MQSLNLDVLVNTPKEALFKDINIIFNKLLQEIGSYLNTELIYKNISINYNSSDKVDNHFINLGVTKVFDNNSLKITISKVYEKFLHIILLREAYKCYIPLELHDHDIINIFLNTKIEIDLAKSEYMEEWKKLSREYLVSYEFKKSEYDRLDKFLKRESTDTIPSPFQFFFSFLRRNTSFLASVEAYEGFYGKKDFYDLIWEEYILKYVTYPDEIIETIKILTNIFYKVKSYKSILDYKKYFKTFKDSRPSEDLMSQRSFAQNMQWIKNNSSLAPSYRINWLSLGIQLVNCYLKFHPILEIRKVKKIVAKIPFFIEAREARYSFGSVIFGYFLIPDLYLNDAFKFLDRLE